MKIGDKVAYSVQFLRSINEITGDMPAARGVIIEIRKLGKSVTLATVAWDRDMPTKVNVTNLAIVGPNSKFCAC